MKFFIASQPLRDDPTPRPPLSVLLARALCVGGALVLGFSSATASAAGLYQDGAGARAQGMAGSGNAVANDPLSALFENPAAMSDLDKLAMQLGIDAGFVQGSFHNRANRNADLDDAGVIGALGIVVPVGPVRFGVGVNPDITLSDDWRYRDAPGGADGQTTYGVRPQESEILLLRSAFGASWQINKQLSIGADVGLLYNYNRLDTTYVFQSQPTLRTAKTLLDLETDGFGWNAQVGLRWRPIPSLALSVNYTSRSEIETHGHASGNAGVQLANLGLGAAQPDFKYDATVTNVFPQQVSAGLAWQAAKRTTLSAQFDWINWSDAFDSLPVRLKNGSNPDLNGLVGSRRLNDNIPLRWDDQFVSRFGVEQGLDDHWTLRAGYAYSNNPVPAETLTPLTAAITEHLLSAGVGYRQDRFRIDAAYQWRIPASERVNESSLASGEYSDSVTRVDIQWFGATLTVDY